MTRRTNARLAGIAFLLYIAAGIAHMVLFGQATGGAEGTSATLASIVRNESLVRLTVILTLVEASCALILGVTLRALTRDVDPDLAVLGFSFRVAEGVVGVLAAVKLLELLSIATLAAGAAGSDAAAASALGGLLLKAGGTAKIAAFLFGVGSLLFCYLLLRGRSIPAWMARLGVLASAMWVIGFPLQLMGALSGPGTYIMWISMALFEVTFAFWLIFKGVAAPATR